MRFPSTLEKAAIKRDFLRQDFIGVHQWHLGRHRQAKERGDCVSPRVLGQEGISRPERPDSEYDFCLRCLGKQNRFEAQTILRGNKNKCERF